jgi:hypothetical protein
MTKCVRMFLLVLFILTVAWTSSLHAGWTINGAPVCVYSGDQTFPVACSDGAGGVIVAWEDRRGYPDIYAQRLDENGRRVWAVDGLAICTASYGQLGPRICSDGAGGAIIAWTDPRAGNVRDIYAQRVAHDGTILWTANGVAVCSEPAHQHLNDICADGFGGAILVWQDERTSASYDDVYCQRIDADGNVLWSAGGVALCTGGTLKEWLRVAPDGSGGGIFTWINWTTADIYAQRVNAAGNTVMEANGRAICSASGLEYEPEIVPDGAGGAIISWTDHRDWYDIYVTRIDGLGNNLWAQNGVQLTVDPGGEVNGWQHHGRLCGDGAGGAIVAWVDQRNDDYDLYAQRVNEWGVAQWTPNGIPICLETGACDAPALLAVSDRGAIIAWEDSRSGTGNDIYVQRVDSLGVVEWTPNGMAVCTADNSQDYPNCVTDGADGAIIAWEDERIFMDPDIYAHRITAGGGFVATLLQSYFASFSERAIVIEWTLSDVDEDARFTVSRATDLAGVYQELPAENLERDGLSFVYRDADYTPGDTYVYRVTVETDGVSRILFVTEDVTAPAASLVLHQNVPNPFNPSTTIRYYLPARCRVTLTIYDATGAAVRRLVEEEQETGPQAMLWNGLNSSGEAVSSGVYFYSIIAGKERASRKMLLLR